MLGQAVRRVDLGQLGEFDASTTDKWGTIGLVVDVPNRHWPGYKTGETPCVIVGFIAQFPWPPDQSQSNESAYIVETEGCEYALQPLQIEDILPPPVRKRIDSREPPGNRPKNCEWDPLRKGFFDKTTGAAHVPGTRSVASQDSRRVLNAAAMSTRRSDTYDVDRSDQSWLIPHGGDIDKWQWLCTLSRLQLPVRLAFAMTINKSQGQSLENVGLYLPRPVFAHGQLYVALSRVGNPDWLKVLVVDSREQGTFEGRDGVYTVNIVYPEILARARELLDKSLAARSAATSTSTAAAPSTICPMDVCPASAPAASESSPMDMCMPCCESEAGPSDLSARDAQGGDAMHAAEDDIDMDAAERATERRLREAGLAVPARLLSCEEVWGLAHASEQSAAVDGEMVDEEADWRPAEPPHVREANARAERRARRAAARDRS